MVTRSGFMVCTMMLLLIAVPLLGETIDRIVLIVENKYIITLSDIRKERVIQAALGTTLGDDDAVAQELVEKYLIEQQIVQFEPIEVPEEDVTERLKTIRAPSGVTPEEIRAAVLSKLRRAKFTLERFGPTIRISDEELRKYFDEEYVPELRRKGVAVPRFEDAAESVRQSMILIRIGDEFNMWLNDLKRRATIETVSK